MHTSECMRREASSHIYSQQQHQECHFPYFDDDNSTKPLPLFSSNTHSDDLAAEASYITRQRSTINIMSVMYWPPILLLLQLNSCTFLLTLVAVGKISNQLTSLFFPLFSLSFFSFNFISPKVISVNKSI